MDEGLDIIIGYMEEDVGNIRKWMKHDEPLDNIEDQSTEMNEHREITDRNC